MSRKRSSKKNNKAIVNNKVDMNTNSDIGSGIDNNMDEDAFVEDSYVDENNLEYQDVHYNNEPAQNITYGNQMTEDYLGETRPFNIYEQMGGVRYQNPTYYQDGTYDESMMNQNELYDQEAYEGYDQGYNQGVDAGYSGQQYYEEEQVEYSGDQEGYFDGFSGRYDEYDEYGAGDFEEDFEEDLAEPESEWQDDTDDFTKKASSFIENVNGWISKNKVVCYSVLGALFVIAIGIIVIAKVRNNPGSVSSNSANVAILEGNISENAAIPQDPLLIDEYPDVNAIVAEYFTARQNNDMDTVNRLRKYEDPIEAAKLAAMSQYVESYNDITCYTKPGPFDNSYLTYVSYNVKLYNWEELAPSLLTLLICTDETGSLYIYSGEFDKNVEQYIGQISQQEDVVDLMTRVDAEYKEVLDSNGDFKDYMSEFNLYIKEEVKNQLAAIKMAEDAANQTEDSVSENEVKEIVTFEVKATDTVNVRASDSEDADRVGRVEAGTVLECYEQRTNGWSQVVYEGEIAYIKSDYLINLSSTRTSTDEDVTGTVRAKETVNIRDKDSTDGRQLGIAYMGETFPLIEKQSNGWTKIVYNDMDAYIKTEYLE